MIKLIITLFIAISLGFASSILPPKVEKTYSMNFTKETVGLVRHLKVYKEPKWVAKIELQNGKEIFFSSPKSMFEFYFRPGKWYDIGVKSEKDFKNIIVTDYMTMKPIDAKTAYYVYGSRAISPGGDDLPAFATKESAEKFAAGYSGKRVMSFQKVSDALIRLINGRI